MSPGDYLVRKKSDSACGFGSGRFHADPAHRMPLSRGARLQRGVGNQRRRSAAHRPSNSSDIIITDMQMPRMSGTELITALKAQPETADIPIVIVAGKNSGFDAQEHRANFAIFKDIDIEAQLTKALEALLGSRVTKVNAAAK
jgi:CheY-like chemotaxis protein